MKLNVILNNSIINFYLKCGDLINSTKLFNEMKINNQLNDIITWNIMINGYIENKKYNESLKLFKEMQINYKLKPDEITIISILNACNHSGLINESI